MKNYINNKINEALYNLYLEVDRCEVNDTLKDYIPNLDEYNMKKKHIIFLLKAKAKQQHNDKLKELVSKFKYAINENIEKPVAVLKHLIQGNPSFALYRNLNMLTNEDLVEIIKDKNFVELLEQLEDNEKSY